MKVGGVRLNQVKLGAVGSIATQWHGFGYETMFDSYTCMYVC